MLLLLACNAESADSGDTGALAYPYTYTPETGLQDYELVRVETETWVPVVDATETLLYAEKSLYHRKGAPVESLAHFPAMTAAIPPLADGVRLSFAGDLMWLGGNWDHTLDAVAPLFDGDLRVANLETPTDPDQSDAAGALGVYQFNASPTYLDGLPVDLLQLDNNHTLDAGESGLTNTLAEVDARGFQRTGVDTHVVLDVGGRKIAFLSYTWGINIQDVVPERELFIVPFGHEGTVDLSTITQEIADTVADTIVVMPHWGYEYEYYPDPHFMVQARELIAAGADLIVGTGPHVVQPPEVCHVNQGVVPGTGVCTIENGGAPRTAAVLYSLGDAATTLQTMPCEVGILATVSVDDSGVTGLGWEPLISHPDTPEVVPASDDPSDDEAEELDRLGALIGTGWRR